MSKTVTPLAEPDCAFVLHRHDWSESSQILELFSRNQGRLTAVAKGAKRPFSQLRSVLMPFQRIGFTLVRAKPAQRVELQGAPLTASELRTLRSAEWAGCGTELRGETLFSGFYLNELLLRLLPRQDPHPALFDVYTQALQTLSQAVGGQRESALRAFEFKLLQALGWLPQLSIDTETLQPLKLDQAYTLDPHRGLIAAPATLSKMTGTHWLQLQAALDQGGWAALHWVCSQSLADLKPALRPMLYHHLGPQPLRTRRILVEVQSVMNSLLVSP